MKESFKVVATVDPLRIGMDYVDQKLFDSYEDAIERGKELLKHYVAFHIEKVYQL